VPIRDPGHAAPKGRTNETSAPGRTLRTERRSRAAAARRTPPDCNPPGPGAVNRRRPAQTGAARLGPQWEPDYGLM